MAGSGEEEWEELGLGPYPVSAVQHTTIPMGDGVRLAAKLFLPTDRLHTPPFNITSEYAMQVYPGGAGPRERKSFGTIMEHSWWASHGFATIRVDIRGSSASEGLYFDEYSRQELDDGAAVIAWVAAQAWSNGRVGLFGKSWGGFNGLMLAAEQPPGLATAVSVYSTDDRYTDDVHYMGGTVLGTGMVSWANQMFAWNARPPPPQYFGHLDEWEAAWRERLDKAGRSWLPIWLANQKRTEPYWAHGSVNEDMSLIKVPILAVGGLMDGYTNAPMRMAETLNEASRVLIGPWGHDWPDTSTPGPRIDFLGECLRWWTAHLTEESDGARETAVADVKALPRLRLFVRQAYTPSEFLDTMPGRWVGLDNCRETAADYRRALDSEDFKKSPFVQTFFFGDKQELTQNEGASQSVLLPLEPHQLQGTNCGTWMSFGWNDLPGDQAEANEHSLCFTSQPLQEDISLSGFATAVLRLRAASAGRYGLAARLCHLQPDGRALRITYGLLNLAHWQGKERPQKAFPGQETLRVAVELNVAGYTVPKGGRLVLALSPSYFPTMHTPAQVDGLALDPNGSRLAPQTLPPEAFRLDTLLEDADICECLEKRSYRNSCFLDAFTFACSLCFCSCHVLKVDCHLSFDKFCEDGKHQTIRLQKSKKL